MEPEKILVDLSKIFSESIAQASGLSTEKSSILSSTVNSVINYVLYKSDPTGSEMFIKDVNQIFNNQRKDVLSTALSLYTDSIKRDLSSQVSPNEILLKAERYLFNPTFQAFVNNLNKSLESKKRKKNRSLSFMMIPLGGIGFVNI